MKATLTKTNHTGKVAPNRKDNAFTQQFTVITPELEDIIQLRIYGTNARNYACVWVHSNPVYLSGGGYAGGYSYHRPSAAAQVAINDAGIVLSEDIGGVGDSAIENALLAIAEALGKPGSKIFRAHGYEREEAMTKDKHKTKVLFVYPKYPDGQREVLALFPGTKSKHSNGGYYLDSYAHIGQHSSACHSFLRRKRATKEQYAPLARELESIGYNLTILNEKE